jgi:formate hydrogenlyase subunit 3/multisubunit Na+/H+ antiporter MnhD subunit
MRQMGGGYLYSFDIAALLFGACLNLAGLPYSAGFLGKEFLLFQLFRDDFISTLVRGCWMVSFFFTPIYMLILVFIVAFGPKKGTLQTYGAFWSLSFKNYLEVFKNKSPLTTLTRFQYSIVTSRTTIYLLFTF